MADAVNPTPTGLPDNSAVSVAPQTPAQQLAGQALPALGPTDSPIQSQAPAQATPGAGSLPQAGAQPAGPFSLMEAMRASGLQADGFQNEQQAWQAISGALREAQQLRQQVIQQHLQQQNLPGAGAAQPAAPAPQQPESWWKAPKIERAWLEKVQRDPQTGAIVPKDGVSFDIARQVENWLSWRQETEQKFYDDPLAVLGPGIEQKVAPLVEKAIEARLGQVRMQAQAAEFERQNAAWLYQGDAQGNLLYDQATRQPILTQAGQAFTTTVQALRQAGVQDLDTLTKLAMQQVHYQALLAQQQNPSAQPPVPGSQQPTPGLPPVAPQFQPPPQPAFPQQPPAYQAPQQNGNPMWVARPVSAHQLPEQPAQPTPAQRDAQIRQQYLPGYGVNRLAQMGGSTQQPQDPENHLQNGALNLQQMMLQQARQEGLLNGV